MTLFILAGLEYFITENEFKDIRENINLIDLSNRRIANLHIIVARIRDLMLINQGVYGSIDDQMDLKIERIHDIMIETLIEIQYI